ncbi:MULTISPECIES: hypothetical protein [Kamptonema]|uniref:hypothetical protein n=1 Tax=Kamptonema TaxID=1501433 RepID=UPI0001DAD744|nr:MULTISPECIES: hypothetical protein [Kamptonema]CBN54799.1 exported hypothetical protein [Kamptonema sp. PCC 6506]
MWKKILAAGIIFSSSFLSFAPVEARQVRQDCVKISGYDWGRFNGSIVVGRKVYNPDVRLDLSNPFEVTCKLLENVSIVNVSLAIPDTSEIESVKVQIYIEGNLSKTVNILRGSVTAFSIDLRGVTNYTVSYQQIGYRGSGRDASIYAIQYWDYN